MLQNSEVLNSLPSKPLAASKKDPSSCVGLPQCLSSASLSGSLGDHQASQLSPEVCDLNIEHFAKGINEPVRSSISGPNYF